MNSEIRKLIDDIADTVRGMYSVSIPIDNIDSVVEKMGGSIKEDINLNLFSDGKIKKHREGFVVYISSSQSEERRAFTIAHELGHLFLHMGYRTHEWENQTEAEFCRNGDSEIELQSNEFAAAFLMPQIEYKKIMDRYTENDMVDISKVAEYFKVSVTAASNRGKWLGYLKW